MLDFGIILSTMYLLPLFYQRGLLVSVALTGPVMLPGGIIINAAATSAIAGRLYDSIGAKRPVLIGFVLAFIRCFDASVYHTAKSHYLRCMRACYFNDWFVLSNVSCTN